MSFKSVPSSLHPPPTFHQRPEPLGPELLQWLPKSLSALDLCPSAPTLSPNPLSSHPQSGKPLTASHQLLSVTRKVLPDAASASLSSLGPCPLRPQVHCLLALPSTPSAAPAQNTHSPSLPGCCSSWDSVKHHFSPSSVRPSLASSLPPPPTRLPLPFKA